MRSRVENPTALTLSKGTTNPTQMPSSTKVPKPQPERVRECLVILSKLIDDLKVPLNNPSICLLKKRMSAYWEDGKYYEDRIPLVGSNRSIMYRFPRWAHQQVEVILRVGPIHYDRLPSSLEGEALRSENSVTQSDPAHPSPAPLPEK